MAGYGPYRVEQVPDSQIPPLHLTAKDGTEQEAIVVRLGDRFTAYVNECAHQAMPLDDALLDREAGTITCPWHGFSFDPGSPASA